MHVNKPISIIGEGSVPLPLGLATYRTLADSFGGLNGRLGGRT